MNTHTHTLSQSLSRSRNCGWWFPYRPVVTVSGGDRARAHRNRRRCRHASRHILYLCMYNSKVHSHMHSTGCAKMGHPVVAQRRTSGDSGRFKANLVDLCSSLPEAASFSQFHGLMEIWTMIPFSVLLLNLTIIAGIESEATL